MRALILSGGGARGAYETGAALSLLQHEPFDIICGTSIGAMNGALVAQDEADKLEQAWRSIASLDVLRPAPEIEALVKVVSDLRQFSEDPLSRRPATLVQLAQDYPRVGPPSAFMHVLGALDWHPIIAALGSYTSFTSLKRTFVVAATNLTEGRPEAFYHFVGAGAAQDAKFFADREPFSHAMTESNYLDAIRASSAIPVALPPVTISDAACGACQYVDGGVTGNAPISQAIHAGADDVTIIYMDRPDLRPPNWQFSSIADVALVSHDIMQQRMIERDLRLAAAVNEAVADKRAPDRRYVAIQVISPEISLGLSVLDFDKQDRIDAAIEQGKRDAERVLARPKVR
ncbi:MAG TPA: patatin-like phospholipase family protein [Candidatus Eremiobacteraceae bacterium]|nr:patatin-like phospholipase family protein [Candidatus Eremiobacteraceae bacterium]